jgi:cyclopropane-fatty-acyl-phospholipid synthase
MSNATAPLREVLAGALPDRPFRIELWDGTSLPSTDGHGGPTFRVRSQKALAHALRAPGQLGIGRAYVAGEIEVDDIDKVLDLLDSWSPPPIDLRTKAQLAAAAARATGLTLPPKPPASELRPVGRRHSRERDLRAVRHHYDVGNEFFSLFLDESMTYSCAVFSRGGATTLEEAQRTKLEIVCGKLDLKPGERLLDVGCGWGSFIVHAAREHGVRATGVTLSEPQAERARRRAEEAGVGHLVDVHVMDWRDLAGEAYDKIASIGMVEHVGSANIDAYSERLASLLRPGGRLLNHGIARLRHSDPEAGPFSERFVFPDAAPLHVSRITFAMERAGLVTRTVEGFNADYAETLRHWQERLDSNHARAEQLAGPERMRVWRLYLRTARRGFESGFIGLYQVLLDKPDGAPVRIAPAP